MAKRVKVVKHPPIPRGGQIAGWYLWEPRAEAILEIREGKVTPADARRLARWIEQWAKWVAYVARKS